MSNGKLSQEVFVVFNHIAALAVSVLFQWRPLFYHGPGTVGSADMSDVDQAGIKVM